MKRPRFNLRTKITFFTTLIIMTSIVFVSMLFSTLTVENLKDKIRVNNMNTAINLGSYSYLGDLIEIGDPEGKIQDYTQSLLAKIENIDMLVIANMDSIRFAHPNPSRLGKRFVGGDEGKVIVTGDTYITEEVGTLGKSIRAFAPIRNSQGNQVGFIMVGTLIKEFMVIKNEAMKSILIYSLGGLVLGLLGAFILTHNIKQSLLGLEPREISRLYTDKVSMLEAIQEGIISIDDNMEITTINDAAIHILGIERRSLLGEKIYNVIPNSKMEGVLKTGNSIIEKETRMNGTNVVTNILPIRSKDEIIGVIATFRDKTEVTKLAEEITGYNEIVKALRANSHEFLNKLHIILGLIQMGNLDEAKEFILGIKNSQEQIMLYVIKKIQDPILVGLILGKISRAKELGVDFQISKESILGKNIDENMNSALVTILGNLIENAFEATVKVNRKHKKVVLSIMETKDKIEISVEDNGIGIIDKEVDKIFNRGYSTKGENRGIGLSLVMERVDSLSGKIAVNSTWGVGSSIEITIPKED
ncbi:ATP-binding protein [Tissierellaceae bacterium HCP3S3_D8]